MSGTSSSVGGVGQGGGCDCFPICVSGKQFYARIKLNSQGVFVSGFYTDQNLQKIDLVAGTFTFGECALVPVPKPHVFNNANIPVGSSTWNLPVTAASPVSQHQVTVRNALGSVVDVRVTSLTTTSFRIDAPVASSNVRIFAEPMETLS
jgi:hypothetical protein